MTEVFETQPGNILQKTLETLTKKATKCRNQTREKNDIRKEITQETSKLFGTSTHITKLPRSAYPIYTTQKRNSSRSRSMSKSRAPRPYNKQGQQPKPTNQATTLPDNQQPSTSTERSHLCPQTVDRDTINRLVSTAIEQYLADQNHCPQTDNSIRGRGRRGQRSHGGRGSQGARGHGRNNQGANYYHF